MTLIQTKQKRAEEKDQGVQQRTTKEQHLPIGHAGRPADFKHAETT